MKLQKLMIVAMSTICFFGTCQLAISEETKSCHCFKNRVYDPADRFAADEYLLATSFNSLIAKRYDIPKKQIVFLKMKGGASNKDLLVALRASQVTGYELQQLLNHRKQNKAWNEILVNPEISAKLRQDKLLFALLQGRNIDLVATEIANNLIAEFYNVSPASVQKMRKAGVNEKEMALVFILAKTKGMQPSAIVEQYQAGKSWSQVAQDLAISPSQVGPLIMAYANP